MNIHIVNYEIGVKRNGILTRYADRMVNGLIRLGHDVTVSEKPEQADINHHINYQSYQTHKGVNTTMVTHIDTQEKLDKMKEVAKEAHGVCFSKDTLDQLVKAGVTKKNLSVIHPAATVTRRPRIIAILTQLYPDGRKRERMLLDLMKHTDREQFVWNIVGTGWEPILAEAEQYGHKVMHIPDYTPEVGQSILNNADYLLYLGEDEGAVSVLDATMAGVRTIAPPVGFHKELGIDHPFRTQKELNAVFDTISENRVKEWTWEKYVTEHVKLWEKLLSSQG